nr:MAG TPA: hypothetical protein [Caudoviricetes sp.]
MYEIGDKIMFRPTFLRQDKDGRRLRSREPVPGQVVYVHPQGRYLVAERRVDDRYTYREAILLAKGEVLNDDDSDHESEGRRGENGNGHQSGRRAGRRR